MSADASGDEDCPQLVSLDADAGGGAAAAVAAVSKPVPVTVITGYLGAGKTTLLNYILTEQHGRRIAVVMNEFGDSAAIEAALTVSEGDAAGPDAGKRRYEEWLELGNGCLCCSLKHAGVSAIERLMERRGRFDYILLETTGLAEPGPIAAMFWLDEQLESLVCLDGFVTMVDCINAHRQFSEAEWLRQVACADTVLLSKADLLADADSPDGAAALARVESLVRGVNSACRIVHCRQGVAPLDSVLDLAAYSGPRSCGDLPSDLPSDLRSDLPSHPSWHHLSRRSRVGTLALDFSPADYFCRGRVEHLLGDLLWPSDTPLFPGSVFLRTKGILRLVDNEDEGDAAAAPVAHSLQGVYELFELKPAGHADAALQRLVFIGEGLPPACRLKELFDACRVRESLFCALRRSIGSSWKLQRCRLTCQSEPSDLLAVAACQQPPPSAFELSDPSGLVAEVARACSAPNAWRLLLRRPQCLARILDSAAAGLPPRSPAATPAAPLMFVRYYPECRDRSRRALAWAALAGRLLGLGCPGDKAPAESMVVFDSRYRASFNWPGEAKARFAGPGDPEATGARTQLVVGPVVPFPQDASEDPSLPRRVSVDNADSRRRIRDSAQTVQLLWARPSEPSRATPELTRSVTFAVYNRARAESLLARVREDLGGHKLGELPPPEVCDDAAWQLAWSSLDSLAGTLDECRSRLLLAGSYAELHRIPQAWARLWREFARFYDRVRVLRDRQDPGMEAAGREASAWRARLVLRVAEWGDLLAELMGLEPVMEM